MSVGVISLPFWLRSLIIIVLTSLSGVFMGFMMPSGIRAVSSAENSIPWLWSINGVFSVLASFAAIFISIGYGFNIVLFISAATYLIGVLTFFIEYFILD